MREGYDCTATAHNASDNAETVLFNLIRGAGTNGLSGIPPVRGSIIRPLILCTKDEIVSECGRRGISFVFDSTNDDTDYTRNFIRHRIVPLAKEINPAFEDAVSSSSEILRRDRAHFDSLSSQYSLSSGRKILSSLDDAVLSRVLLDSLRNAGISPDSEHITNAAEMIRSEKVRSSLSLPGGVFSIDRDNLRARISGYSRRNRAIGSLRGRDRSFRGHCRGIRPELRRFLKIYKSPQKYLQIINTRFG